jgi:hypothetical protein
MKNILIIVFFIISSFANANKNNQNPQSFFFTENKGQVCDQNYLPRPDVLFSGSDGKFEYHIKNNGISYQLSKIESWKKQNDFPGEKTNLTVKSINEALIPDKISVYRIDVSWLNADPQPKIQKEEALLGYNNYYLQHCPQGILNVQSYKGIIIKNLYNGINLHYYEMESCLKYDFVVSPNSDYKKIQLGIEGADISMQDDGSLLLKTPFGNIQEGKPVAFQNGKELKARWKKEGNKLSFEIENVNPELELIIDPPTRIWGTYYGGTVLDQATGTATDNLGNVYIVGCTYSGSSIATSGAHQTVFGGGSGDAFVAKFNSSGIRLWGTYYGSSARDFMRQIIQAMYMQLDPLAQE